MPLCKGDRVFMSDSQTYGKIFRTGVLGLKSGGYVVLTDNGKSIVYTGEKAKHNLVCPKSCTNNCGEKQEVPLDIMDLFDIGVPIMERNEVPKLKQLKIKSNMIKLGCEEKMEFKNNWESTGKSDKKKIKLLLSLC